MYKSSITLHFQITLDFSSIFAAIGRNFNYRQKFLIVARGLKGDLMSLAKVWICHCQLLLRTRDINSYV